MNGRVLAVDYGRRRVGLALSDPTGTIATGLETLVVNSVKDAVTRIAGARQAWEYERIVVGLPLRTTGGAGAMTGEVLAFVERLRTASGVPVETIDERYTSAEAERIFHQTGRHIKGRKGDIDRLAAEILLRQYLDSQPGNAGLTDEAEG